MEHHDEGLLRIGLFSRLTTISVRMLRHYHDQHLLQPAVIDPFTGHRFYSPSQLIDAHWIARLRDAGLPVSQIKEVMAHRGDPERQRMILTAHEEYLSQEQEKLSTMREAFDRLNTYLQESTMEINVRRIHMPAMTVATLHRIIPAYFHEGELWEEFTSLLAENNLPMFSDGQKNICGATYLDHEYRESDVDVEIWMQVVAPFTPVAPLGCRDIPARDVVVATLHGSYDGMNEVTAAIGTYIAAHNLDTGPMFNIYRVSPAQSSDPSEWVTDVCFPIKND